MIGFACKRYPAVELFRKMRGLPEFPNEQKGAGDVISHLSEYDGKHHNVVLFYNHSMVLPLSISAFVAVPFALPLFATRFVALGFLSPLPPPINTKMHGFRLETS